MLLALLVLGGGGRLIVGSGLRHRDCRKDKGAGGEDVDEFHKIFSWCSPVVRINIRRKSGA